MPEIEIKFDGYHGYYYSGQRLSGSVTITLPKPKKIRGIYVEVLGEAVCRWSERHGGGKTSRTVYFDGREDYLNSRTYLAGTPNGDSFELATGILTYTFSCDLPDKLPTSLEANNGHIRYMIRVVMDRPWKFNHIQTVAFTVFRPHNLNLEPQLGIPSRTDISKSFCCYPCKSKPLYIEITLMKSGYIPGEMIGIFSKIINESNVSVEYMEFVLRQTLLYTSQSPYIKVKTESTDIACLRGEGVRKYDRTEYQKSLAIISVPATMIHDCRVVQIMYDLVVKAIVPGCFKNVKFSQPITIGTIPINSTTG